MILPRLILVLATASGGGADQGVTAEEVLAAADRAAQAHEYERATEMCLELAARDGINEQSRQDALQTALGYADIAADEAGTVEPLCHAYASLVEHGRGDVLALKPEIEARLESIAGASWRDRCSGEPKDPADPVDVSTQEKSTSTPERLVEPFPLLPTPDIDEPQSPRSRPLVVAGAALVSIGAASLAGMGATFIVWNHNGARIKAYTASVEAGQPKTPAMKDKVDQLSHSDDYLRPLAIATGALGAVTVITGAALLIVGHKRSRDINVAPSFTRTFGGLTLTTRF